MRSHRPRALPLPVFLLLLLPLPARAALTPVGAPLVIADEPFCSFDTHVEVMATPKGAFEAVWVDETHFDVRGLRFARNLQPTGPPRSILPLHGGLNFDELAGFWAGPYELVLNVVDTGTRPADPLAAYRAQLGIEGVPLAPAARVKPPRFVKLAPAAGGDSLQFRFEPPLFGPNTCRSQGLLARRVDRTGAPKSPESRVNRRASAWGSHLEVDRLPDDTFLAVYGTCQRFLGLVARRLNAAGAPVGKPIDLPLPDRFGDLALAARGATDFAVATTVFSSNPGVAGGTIQAVTGGEVVGPTRFSGPAGFASAVDLAASPDGGYLLLFRSGASFFAQELDARGVPQESPLEIAGDDEESSVVSAAAAALPNGRWIVVTRAQRGDILQCAERVVGTVLGGG